MKLNKKVVVLNFIFFFHISVCSLYGTVSKSDSYSLLSASIVENKANQSSVNFVVSQDLSREAFVAERKHANGDVDIGFLYTLGLRSKKDGLSDIEKLYAQAYALGPIIEEKKWQNDADPYFYWEVSEAENLLSGYSYTWNAEPDDIVDSIDSFYQVPSGLLQDGKSIFGVKSIDLQGNSGEPVFFEIWIDSEPPSLISVEPEAGIYTSNKLPEIKLKVQDEFSGIDKDTFIFTLNDSVVTYEYLEETGIVVYKPVIDLPEGNNQIRFLCYDLAKNKTVELLSNFYVDSVKPTGEIVINGGEESSYSYFINLSINALDTGSGLKEMMISNNNDFSGAVWEPYVQEKTQWQLSASSGYKTVYIKFKDVCGNISSVSSDTIAVLVTGVDTLISRYPEKITTENIANFQFVSSQSGAEFSYRIDNQPWTEWDDLNSVMFEELELGNHYFAVKSIYGSKEDSSPAVFSWTIVDESELYSVSGDSRIVNWYNN